MILLINKSFWESDFKYFDKYENPEYPPIEDFWDMVKQDV